MVVMVGEVVGLTLNKYLKNICLITWRAELRNAHCGLDRESHGLVDKKKDMKLIVKRG